MLPGTAAAVGAGAAGAAGGSGGSVSYVALGDSIAAYFGLEEGQGYAELLADKLVGEGGYASVSLENLAQSGDDTQDLLAKIEDNKDAIANADIVTICIGGNNFLGTLITGMVAPLGLSQETLINQGYALFNMQIADDMFSLAATGLQTPEIQAALAHGIARFRADLPVIISNIRELSPDATILIMTVYNPLEPEHPIYPLLNPVTNQINELIRTADDVTVVDIYAVFEEYNGKGVKDQLSLGSIDPHPSALGQRVIANEHYKAITGWDSDDIVVIIPTENTPPATMPPASEPPVAADEPTDEGVAATSLPSPAAVSETAQRDSDDGLGQLIIVLLLSLAALAALCIVLKRRKKRR